MATLKQRRELTRLHIVPLIGKERLSRLTMPKAEAFRDALLATRSRSMAGKVIRALSSAIIEGMRQGLVAQNVARGVRVKNKGRDQAPIDIPGTDVLRAMLETAQNLSNKYPNAYPLVLLAMSAGLRSSELRGLRWPDVDLAAGTLSIKQRADARSIIGKCKSKAAYRTIPLAAPVVVALKTWKLRCPANEGALAFPNGAGRPHHPNNLREYLWTPILIAIGAAIDTSRKDRKGKTVYDLRYGLHHLRHACASRWIKQKIDLKRLTTWLGHSSVQITLDV